MSNIDVAIPLIGGLAFAIWPRALLSRSEDEAVNEANARNVRLGGLGFLVIAVGYALLKFIQSG